jgi:hypothetical protein
MEQPQASRIADGPGDPRPILHLPHAGRYRLHRGRDVSFTPTRGRPARNLCASQNLTALYVECSQRLPAPPLTGLPSSN